MFKTSKILSFVSSYKNAIQKYNVNIKIKYQKMAISTCFSFKKGYRQLPIGITKQVQSEIMSALRLEGRMSWYNRLNGRIEPKITEVQKIEEIFHNYNITEIWGE